MEGVAYYRLGGGDYAGASSTSSILAGFVNGYLRPQSPCLFIYFYRQG